MELRLTLEEINNLILVHKTIKNKNEADKIKCIIYWGKGLDIDIKNPRKYQVKCPTKLYKKSLQKIQIR